jgi:kynureninase
VIYLDGNSLGPAPEEALAELSRAAEGEWAQDLIQSWNKASWFELPLRYGDLIAPIVGADAGEIAVCDTTSLNIFKTLHAALAMRPDRGVIVAEAGGFPTDLYVTEGVAATRPGASMRLEGVDGPDLIELIDADVAVVLVNQVDYRTGRLRDLAAVTAKAHAVGALVVWDLCHSAGVVEVGLNAGGADMAVGCSYKYLNGGPGAPAFLYIRRDLQETLINPIAGWMSQANLFDFGLEHKPVAGLRRFLSGTPPVLSQALIEVGVDLLLSAGMDALRAKSVQQTEYLVALWEAMLQPLGYTLNSPRDPARRGSHISLGHREGLRIDLALIRDCNVLPDFRYPDNIRIGIAPLYNTFADVHAVATRLAEVVQQGVYKKYPTEKPVVT